MERRIIKNRYGRTERYFIEMGYLKREFIENLEFLKKDIMGNEDLDEFDFEEFLDELEPVGLTVCNLDLFGNDMELVKESLDYLQERIAHYTEYPIYDVDVRRITYADETELSIDVDNCMIQSYMLGTLTKEFISQEEIKEITYRELGNLINRE